MSSFEELLKQLERQIANVNNTITKANTILSLETILPLLDESNIWNLSQKEYEQINTNLVGENKLTNEEKSFFQFIINMPEHLKQIKKETVGLSQNQKEIFISIQNKIKNARENYSDSDLDKLNIILSKYKTLLNKLKNNDVNLISELDIITEIIEKHNFTFQEKLDIYEKINEINSRIFKNYNISNIEEEEEVILSEESLVETNLDASLLDELFAKFNIKWEINGIEDLTPQQQQKRTERLMEFKKRLLKYGNYNKMLDILNLIVEKGLTFVFEEHEILTKTLLFSSKEQINDVINISITKKINYHDLFRNNCTIFFPQVREINHKIRRGKSSIKAESNISGTQNIYLKNIKLLDDLNIPANKVYEDCPSFFTRSPKTAKKVYDRLSLYGISFRYPDGSIRKGFSALGTLDVLDKMDMGIECGCYKYYQDNISKLVDTKLNLYRVKLAKSLGIKDEEIFKYYKNGHTGCYLPAVFGSTNKEEFGKSPEDTFKKYNAVQFESEFKEMYDNIIANSENDIISEIVLEDEWIQKLDNMYKDDQSNLIYNFNGVIISRLKVLRYYQTLISDSSIGSSKEVLMYAITKGSMLNEEEMKKIHHCLGQINFKGRDLS